MATDVGFTYKISLDVSRNQKWEKETSTPNYPMNTELWIKGIYCIKLVVQNQNWRLNYKQAQIENIYTIC